MAAAKLALLGNETAMGATMESLKQLALRQAQLGETQVRAMAERQRTVADGVDERVRQSLVLVIGIALVIVAATMAIGITTVRTVTQRLNAAVAVAEQVSSGHLVAVPEAAGTDETARLMNALGRMVGTLTGIVGNIRHAADSIHVGTNEISRGNEDLSVRTEQQATQLQQTAAAVEQRSEHPIGAAIVRTAEKMGLKLAEAHEVNTQPGYGISGWVNGHLVQVGADRFLGQNGIDISVFRSAASDFAVEGKSPLYAALDGKLAAVLAVADPIKESTPVALQALKKLGLQVAMLTGDNRLTANAVAKRLGIDEVEAEILPHAKADEVKRFQAQGRKVAFVGDGINDAPALAQADLGIALGTGTDIAMQAAALVLMKAALSKIHEVFALARKTGSIVRQNLFWAFFYNASLIPVAAGVLFPFFGILLSPVLAAAAMAVSSTFVLTNALRLRRFRPTMDAPAEMAHGPTFRQ
mgnify:CR=1 FL=1